MNRKEGRDSEIQHLKKNQQQRARQRDRQRKGRRERERGRQGHGAAGTGAERKRTPRNRPEKLWGEKRQMQIRTNRWKRKNQQWAAEQRQ